MRGQGMAGKAGLYRQVLEMTGFKFPKRNDDRIQIIKKERET